MTSRWQKTLGILGLGLLVWVGSEMYEVLYGDLGGEHAPEQQPAVENPNQDVDPDAEGDHTPPQGGHP